MKPLEDYTFVRGFNYTQSNVITDTNFWEEYDHDIVERDMGYAERLRLNSARIFLTYSSYVKDPEGFLRNVQDFMDKMCIRDSAYTARRYNSACHSRSWNSRSGRCP